MCIRASILILPMETAASGLVPELILGCSCPDVAGGMAVKQITQEAACATQCPQSPCRLFGQYLRDEDVTQTWIQELALAVLCIARWLDGASSLVPMSLWLHCKHWSKAWPRISPQEASRTSSEGTASESPIMPSIWTCFFLVKRHKHT